MIREVEEEVGLRVRVERLLGIYSVPEKDDVVFTFRCEPISGVISISAEADDVRWFSRGNPPKNTLSRHVERIQDAYANARVVLLRTQALME